MGSITPGFRTVAAGPLGQAREEFPYSIFAFVMATGIVSIAFINLIAYPLLWALLLLHLARNPYSARADLSDHRRAPAMLTIVAATCVLGNEVALAGGHPAAAVALWGLALLLWAGLLHSLFAAMTLRRVKPAPEAGLDGSWLLAVVATEALAILTLGVAGTAAAATPAVFAGLCLFLLGAGFYAFLIAAIVWRWLFLPFTAADLAPSYWINMGAAAITTLAGARLVAALAADTVLAPARGFVFAATVLLCALASWWIPLLAGLFAWRCGRGLPLAYRHENWAIVFPLGMYTTATWRFSHALGLPYLGLVPQAFVWVALAAWCLTFAGMVRALLRPSTALR